MIFFSFDRRRRSSLAADIIFQCNLFEGVYFGLLWGRLMVLLSASFCRSFTCHRAGELWDNTETLPLKKKKKYLLKPRYMPHPPFTDSTRKAKKSRFPGLNARQEKSHQSSVTKGLFMTQSCESWIPLSPLSRPQSLSICWEPVAKEAETGELKELGLKRGRAFTGAVRTGPFMNCKPCAFWPCFNNTAWDPKFSSLNSGCTIDWMWEMGTLLGPLGPQFPHGWTRATLASPSQSG